MSQVLATALDDLGIAAQAAPERFAAGYAGLAPVFKGRLKTAIAALFSLYHSHQTGPSRSTTVLAPLLAVTEARRARPFALILTRGKNASPAALLAASLPALLSGVPEVAVASAGRLSGDCLAALELSGIETVLELGQKDLSRLLPSLAGGDGIVLCLSPGLIPGKVREALAGRLTLWDAPDPVRLAVLCARRARFDLESIALAHPGANATVYGQAPEALPPGWEKKEGGLAGLLAARPLAAFVPGPDAAKAAGEIPLILSPGQEATFVWPEITRETFFTRAAVLATHPPV